MTTTVADHTTVRWEEPAGVNPRGTLAVLPGRGESAQVYRRFAARISADAYRVAVLARGDDVDPVAQVRALTEDPWTVAPVVVVGSDSGAVHALSAAVALADDVAAVIIAGLPVTADLPERSWDAEIELRTACPTHQGVLRSGARGFLAGVDTVAAPDPAPTAPVPVLAVHGSADEISPLDEAVEVYRALPNVTVAVVEDGRHDILNDVTHRSVAATVVLFLERLRLGAALPEIVRDVSGR